MKPCGEDRARAEALAADLEVSRETWDRLATFVSELTRWEKAQNLVGPGTVDRIWSRHVADSLQLLPFVKGARKIADIGSGAGFPGLVTAIALGAGVAPQAPELHLIESNKRKAAFLRAAARACGVRVEVHGARAEKVLPGLGLGEGGVITARALAPLEKLLDLAEPALAPGVVCLFHKGRSYEMELSQATRYWTCQAEVIASRLADDSVILRISHAARREA